MINVLILYLLASITVDVTNPDLFLVSRNDTAIYDLVVMNVITT